MWGKGRKTRAFETFSPHRKDHKEKAWIKIGR